VMAEKNIRVERILHCVKKWDPLKNITMLFFCKTEKIFTNTNNKFIKIIKFESNKNFI